MDVIFFLVAMMLSNAEAAPYSRWSGKTLRWEITRENPIVTYYIDEAAAENADMIREVFEQWQGIPTAYITFQEVTSEDAAQITVTEGTINDPFKGGLAERTFASDGATLLKWKTTTKKTSDNAWRMTGFLHEIGHCLGLVHSIANRAVMSYRPGSTLTTDDHYALTLLYPEDDDAAPMGCGSIGKSDEGDGNKTFFLSLLCICTLAWQITRLSSKSRHPTLTK